MDFKFLCSSNWPSVSKKWVISAPRRAKRPDVAHGTEPACPFCPGRENQEPEVFRLSGLGYQLSDTSQSVVGQSVTDKQKTEKPDSENREPRTDNWVVRVLNNKFPFAPIHEIVIHSPNHHKNFAELPLAHTELILKTYRHRYLEHAHKGNVFIFHNRGEKAGESLPHPHSQIAVIPFEVELDTPRLDNTIKSDFQSTDSGVLHASALSPQNDVILANGARPESSVSDFEFLYSNFSIFCPESSQWPDEVWITPKTAGRNFGEITDLEIADLAFALSRLIEIFDARHGSEFPFNFYIYPGENWYLRLIPRLKTIGGFELSSGIFVNTQDPRETIAFIKEHFETPNHEKIKTNQQADYHKHA